MSVATPETVGGSAAISPSDAAVHAVSSVLWLWGALGLELGEIAVVTDGHPYSRLAAVVATWYGASVILVTREAVAVLPGVTVLADDGATDAVKELAARLRQRPAVVAAELSGRAEAVDLLLEAMPLSARVMLAGGARERLTIDYYVNVHRKGLRLLSGLIDDESVLSGAAARSRLQRSRHLLLRPYRLTECLRALAGEAQPIA